MPTDFYTFRKICFEYKNQETIELKEHEIEGTRENFEWWDCEMYDDEELIDFYDRFESQKRYQIFIELEKNPRIDIFKNGIWKCEDLAKENYISLAKRYNISSNSIISIWRESDYFIK